MSRLLRAAAAGLLTVVLCLGTSTGPVLADDQDPADPTATVAPSPTETAPTPPEPTETTPATSAPTTTSESSPSTAPVTPTAELADLQLRVWFEKPSYQSTEVITAHASVTNAGTATAKQVVLDKTGNLSSVWYPFWPHGVTVAPGQTVEGTLSAHISNDEDAVRLIVTVSQRGGEPDANPEDNTVSASVPIVIVRGSFRGTVFGDRNGNGAQDPGEELAGITVGVRGGRPHTSRTETTGADGTFQFRDLPVGEYYTQGDATGWYLPRVDVSVRGPDDPAVLIRAIPEVRNSLTMSLIFSQQSYRVNDRATAVLALTNTSTVLLSDLVAECSLPYQLHPDQPDVGELTPGRGGVTVPAGATRHYPITVPITERASMIGHVRLYCQVGAPPRQNGPYVGPTAVARVPGGVATRVTRTLLHHRGTKPRPEDSPPVPGVKVYLRDSISGAIVTSDVTDANGGFTFCNLPVGPYSLGMVGPWHPWGSSDFVVRASENGENGSLAHYVFVAPGPYQPNPPDSATSGCGAPPDAAPPGGAPQLAATGAGVTRLALSGLLTLLVGTGLVLLARQAPNGPGSRRT